MTLSNVRADIAIETALRGSGEGPSPGLLKRTKMPILVMSREAFDAARLAAALDEHPVPEGRDWFVHRMRLIALESSAASLLVPSGDDGMRD